MHRISRQILTSFVSYYISPSNKIPAHSPPFDDGATLHIAGETVFFEA
jgi:hypothetical protein